MKKEIVLKFRESFKRKISEGAIATFRTNKKYHGFINKKGNKIEIPVDLYDSLIIRLGDELWNNKIFVSTFKKNKEIDNISSYYICLNAHKTVGKDEVLEKGKIYKLFDIRTSNYNSNITCGVNGSKYRWSLDRFMKVDISNLRIEIKKI